MSNSKKTVEDRSRELAGPLIAAEGMELVDVEYVHEREGWVLRMYIDRPGGGVGVDDCAKVTHAVETVFDVEDLIPHEYHLEVSSPGLNRPLKTADHFRRAMGRKVKVKTFAPIGQPPRKNFSGMLRSLDEDAVMVEVEGAGAFRIPLKEIAKANVEFEF